jgi:hypothetical protein
MKPLAGSLFLILAGCSVPEQPDDVVVEKQAAPASRTRSSIAPIAPEAATGAEERDAAHYAQYPLSVRPLIRKADSLNDACRGTRHAETEAVCARRDRLIGQIRSLGWCWGGADFGYLQHWLPCAEDHPGGRGWREPEGGDAGIAEAAVGTG